MDSSCMKNYCTHEIDSKNFFETFFSAHVPYSVSKETTINAIRSFCKSILYRDNMDSSSKKNYCIHELDPKKYFETFFSAHTPYSVLKETTINMLHAFYKAFCTGMVTGRTVVDFSISPVVNHLSAICDFVQKITVLQVNDGCLKELEKWKNKDQDAFDWTYATKFLQEFKENSDELEDKEEKLRVKIDKIVKWDPNKCDPADVLSQPEADLAINYVLLESISKDHADYRRNLRKMSNCIKPGGYFLSYAPSNGSYFNLGEDKFHLLPCDERFYRKAISEEGFEIEHFKKFDRLMCTDVSDQEGVMFIIARKFK